MSRRQRVPLPKAKWVKEVVAALYELAPVSRGQLSDRMLARHGCSSSSTYRALRLLLDAGHVSIRETDTSWKASRRGRRPNMYVLTQDGARAAAKLFESTKPLVKRGPGRYGLMARPGKEKHDLLVGEYVSCVERAIYDASYSPACGVRLAVEKAWGEAGAALRTRYLNKETMRPDALLDVCAVVLSAEADDVPSPWRAQVFVEVDMDTERKDYVLRRIRRYANLIRGTTMDGRNPDPNVGRLPVLLYVAETPKRALSIRRWMLQVIDASGAEYRTTMLAHGIRIEDLFGVTCPQWWEARGVLGEAYLTAGSRLRLRDSGTGPQDLSVRGLGGFVSLPSVFYCLMVDKKRGFVETELSMVRSRVGARLRSHRYVNLSRLERVRSGAQGLSETLRRMRQPAARTRTRRPRRS